MVPSGKDVCTKQLYSLIDKIENVEVNESQIEPFLPAIYEKLRHLEREELIKHFVSAEFNRFLSYYKGARDLNVAERGKERGTRDNRRRAFTQFFINLGTKNHINPGKLIGVINESLQSDQARIGKIEVLKKFSFFEVEEGMETAILTTMNGKAFGGTTIQVEVTEKRPQNEEMDRRRGGGGKSKHRKGGGGGRPGGRSGGKSGGRPGGRSKKPRRIK